MQQLRQPLRILARLFKQSIAPFILALAYASWDYHSVEVTNRTAAGFVKSVGVAFFLIMWFAGQWFRASKQIADDDNATGMRGMLDELTAMVRAMGHPPEQLAPASPVEAATHAP